ncbi:MULTISPECIES: PAS domain S-box protein [unclassified Massilia]|uniref:PAS domain S-box protein n=1 Tax=unclassified Massilia TaxID=2609279 RepID=UPI00177D1C4B|nr:MULTISPECIES: PAS domain S-box protein [unclassified Massilia]MBD8529197.1 PAS domain S-box protein [Massilia sp. CFBP 13647]MBD8672591.1 PAS domain S-box protein [Massilia sp. CFBP 13721]
MNHPRVMPSPALLSFLDGTGELGALVAGFDWSATSLGAIETWPQSVKSTVSLILHSPFPIVTMWGEEGVMIYNSGYAEIARDKHPALLGTVVRDAWPEARDFNDHVMRVCMTGKTLHYEEQELTLHRNGRDEQIWFNLHYSPIVGESNVPAGVMAMVEDTTDDVRVERFLKSEHTRLEAMFNQAPGFMALLDGPEHRFVQVNQAYLALVNGRDVLGKTLAEALPEALAQGFGALLDSLYASGEVYSGVAAPFAVGTVGALPAREVFVDFVYQPLRDESGKVYAIFVQGADVTARVLAEQAMRASEAMFRTLAQSLPNQVWSSPPDGVLDWYNDRVYSYSGHRLGELDSGRWADMVHPDDLGAAAAAWRHALASGTNYEIEFRLRDRDGNYRWHLSRALPIRDDAGTIQRWVGNNTDIDDQKTAAHALAHLNGTLAEQVSQRTAERDRIWRLSTELMLVADFSSNIVAVNPSFTTLLGWSETELVGSPFMALVHPEDVAATLREVGGLSEGQTTFRFENRYRHRDGSYRTLAWSAAPDANHIHAVARDVTAEREAAAAMRRTEQALQQSQKMETIGKLTGGVAHDFNNLLQVIAGNLQLLGTDVATNPRALRRVDNAMGGVLRGAKLASQLLAFGRRQALEPKVVRIGRNVAAMDDMLRRTLGEEIETETVVQAGLWNAFVDVSQVENAILNLCINARDAMDGVGKLTVEVGNAVLDDIYASVHPDVTPGQYVMIAVSDTGSGMPPDVIAQAFEPFFSTKPEGKGTGLGLSMVYGFARQSGGHVKIYSEVGFGTTVKMYLPRSLEAEDVLEPVELREPTGGTETILVAEDDDAVRETVVDLLGELGYRVLKASDAASALAIISSGIPIDLLFTDVVMPGTLRSPDLARKAREAMPNLAVLFTSGYTENAIVHGGRLDPGVELLGKPYTRAALASKIRHVLANRSQRSGAARDLAQARAQVRPVRTEPGALNIVLVEDDESLRATTMELLELLGHAVSGAGSAEAALALPALATADVLMTDLELPGMSGEQLAIAARALAPELMVVFASGRSATTSLARSVMLSKPYEVEALQRALAGQ